MSNSSNDGNEFQRVRDRHVVRQSEQQGSWGQLSGRARADIITGARGMGGALPEHRQGDPRTVEGSTVDFDTARRQEQAQRYPLEKGTPEYTRAVQQYNNLYGNYIRMDEMDYDHNEVLRMLQRSSRNIYDRSTSNIYPNRQSNNPEERRLAINKEIEEFIDINFNRDLISTTTFDERDERRMRFYRSERSQSLSDESTRRQERRHQLQEILADDSTTEIGEIERNRPSYDPALGWRGSSRAGFEGLVRQVVELGPQYYNSRLSDTVYSLYRAGKVSRRPFSGVSIPLSNISCPRGVVKRLGNSNKFIYFLNEEVYNREVYGTGEKNIMRMVLNIKPDMINETTQDIVNHIVTLDYVALAKVESDPQGAKDNFDNMII